MLAHRIDVANQVGTCSLIGRPLGTQHLPILLQAALPFASGDVVIWDCREVDVLSASYVAATFLALIRMLASGAMERHFILENIPTDSIEDVRLALEHGGVPAYIRDARGNLSVLGPLDPANADALALVNTRGQVSARQLADDDPSIGQTGWIKRLTTLAMWGLIHRTKRGREFLYEPIRTEPQHG